jgi:plastocyanin
MRFYALLVAGAVGLTGCGDGYGEGDTPPPTDNPGGAASLNGCDEADYADRTDAAMDRRIGFGSALNSPAFGYSPACITISVGQSVTFVGNFASHPLVPGTVSGGGASANNPIQAQRSGSADYMVSFPTAGSYPYFCDVHKPGMAGVVRVR